MVEDGVKDILRASINLVKFPEHNWCRVYSLLAFKAFIEAGLKRGQDQGGRKFLPRVNHKLKIDTKVEALSI